MFKDPQNRHDVFFFYVYMFINVRCPLIILCSGWISESAFSSNKYLKHQAVCVLTIFLNLLAEYS